MRHLLSIACLAVFASTSHANLVLTGVYDVATATGTPKGMELYVLADIPDLSIYGIGTADNGGGSEGEEFMFPADSASQGDFIYVTTASPTAFQNFFGVPANYTGSMTMGVGVNGNDAVELYQNGSVIDVFGDLTHGGDPAWDYEEGWVYRKDNTGPDGSTYVATNWTVQMGALDGATNGGSTLPMPIGTYVAIPEPSAFLCLGLVGIAYGGLTSRKSRRAVA